MSGFKTVGVIGKPSDARVLPTLRAVCRHLRARRRTVLLEQGRAGRPRVPGTRPVTRAELARACDLAIVVGGDGTLLNAGRALAPAGVPVLGVNVGRLGFMVDVAPEALRAALDQVLRGDCVREPRALLAAEIRRGRARRNSLLAINDVVVRNQASVRMLEFETWLDDEFISQHRADGFIVATTTGSTAYALSGGGPVLHPALDAVALVPICPHALSDRPLVVPSDRTVRIVLRGARAVRATCTVDGQQSHALAPGDAVRITRSPHVLELIHPENYSYFNVLRNKLHWGRERSGG